MSVFELLIAAACFCFFLTLLNKKKKKQEVPQDNTPNDNNEKSIEKMFKNLQRQLSEQMLDHYPTHSTSKKKHNKNKKKPVTIPQQRTYVKVEECQVQEEIEPIQVEEITDDIEHLLPNFQDEDELRKAIITSEILNRKY